MIALMTQLFASGKFCKLCYDTIPVKSASANVSFYTSNWKMPNFELWHSFRKWAICVCAMKYVSNYLPGIFGTIIKYPSVWNIFWKKISFLAFAEQMLSIAETKVYMQRKPQWLRMPVSSNLKNNWSYTGCSPA